MDSISGSGRSPGGGHGNPLQYSCLENSIDREAWRAIVNGVAKSQTRSSTHTHTHTHTPSLYQDEENDSNYLETVIKGEGNDLYLYTHHTLIHSALPGKLPNLTASALSLMHLPQPHLLLSLAEDVI